MSLVGNNSSHLRRLLEVRTMGIILYTILDQPDSWQSTRLLLVYLSLLHRGARQSRAPYPQLKPVPVNTRPG
jgi:hypothetical protein